MKRDQTNSKPIIVLIDGDRALEKALKETIAEKGVAHRIRNSEAQEMLNIRAVKKNGDWQEYTQSFIDHEQQQLYQRAA